MGGGGKEGGGKGGGCFKRLGYFVSNIAVCVGRLLCAWVLNGRMLDVSNTHS